MDMNKDKGKYEMTLTLNVLNHLGLNLYSNIPSVLSEVVANSYDADATVVNIDFLDGSIKITDDGNGMTEEEINSKFLKVGYKKRESGEALSLKYNRPVMGRKGIGKLSLFSIANTIELHSYKEGTVSSLQMTKKEITRQIKENNGKFYPTEIPSIDITKGTTIIISDLKKTNYQPKSLRKRLAKRFSVIGESNKFSVVVDGDPITIKDREYLSKVQFVWQIGDEIKINPDEYTNIIDSKIITDSLIYNHQKQVVTGWIGTVKQPSQLDEDGTNSNKISILCRGKVAQEDILDTYTEGGIYADYLVGEIEANFLDVDNKDDIATSSRQNINEDDPRFQAIKEYIYKILKQIQNSWTELRNARATEEILNQFPAVKHWYDDLPSDKYKKQARKLFKTIDTLHLDKGDGDQKKTLVRQAVLAFEQLKVRDALESIDKITNSNDLELVSVFGHLNEIEALLYYDIAKGRIKVIRELQQKVDDNVLEKIIQKHIFDNLWLLNPSWERATQGSEMIEARIGTQFKKVTKSFSKKEKNARMDIAYRSSGGKHIIVELKKYKPSYRVDPFILAAQIDKYYKALRKVLLKSGSDPNPHIEVICILGELHGDYSREDYDAQLRNYNGRVYPYDQLIQESLDSYQDYLKREDKVGKIKTLLDKI